MQDNVRFPAEWEPQAAILIAWPNADTDWAERLAEVEDTYIALVAAIVRFQRVVICVADDDVETYAEMRLRSNRVDMERVRFVTVPYDDTWLRDSGPITLRGGDGFRLLDFRFTGWGGKFGASDDDQLVERLTAQQLFTTRERQVIDFALEGGAIETDGEGSLLTTWRCLHERHPDATREELTAKLSGWLRQDRVLWLDHGALEGDDTDAHIDTLARFAAPDAIVFQACDDPDDSHFADLRVMADMGAGHDQAILADPGHPAAALGPGAQRRALADAGAGADGQPGALSLELQVLRDFSDAGEGPDGAIVAEVDVDGDHGRAAPRRSTTSSATVTGSTPSTSTIRSATSS